MREMEALERKLDGLLLAPDHFQLFNDIGVILLKLQEKELALMYFQRGYQLMNEKKLSGEKSIEQKDLLAHYGLVLYQLGLFSEALTIYQEALILDPENEVLIESLGEIYYLLGNYTESEQMYEKQKNRKGMGLGHE